MWKKRSKIFYKTFKNIKTWQKNVRTFLHIWRVEERERRRREFVLCPRKKRENSVRMGRCFLSSHRFLHNVARHVLLLSLRPHVPVHSTNMHGRTLDSAEFFIRHKTAAKISKTNREAHSITTVLTSKQNLRNEQEPETTSHPHRCRSKHLVPDQAG